MERIRRDSSSRIPLDAVPIPPPPQTTTLAPSAYVELSLHSNFSFLQGASSPQHLVERARALGYDAIAITDRDGLYGAVRAYEEAKKQNVRLILGCELTLERDLAPSSGRSPKGAPPTLLVHVETHEGYTNLCRILTESHERHPKGKPRKDSEGLPRNVHAGVPLSFVCANAEGLWATTGELTENAWSEESLRSLHDAFGSRASLSLHVHRDGEDRARFDRTMHASEVSGLPIVAVNTVRYATAKNKPVYDILHCIREGVTLDAAGRALSPNAEAHLKSPEEMVRLFRDHPSWIRRSRTIADACTFDIKSLCYRFPCELEEPSFPGETPDQALSRLTWKGARERLRVPPLKTIEQIDKELEVIKGMGVAPYFLSVHSIIEMAKRKDILCQGRGSAANSVVCYCLAITAVDPAQTELLFERFLSTQRAEPPDIDVDFEHERREDVIQEIYKRYGRDRAAMVSEVICYRGKSALREVGKVFGLSLEQIDRLSAVVTHFDSADAASRERLRHAGFDADDHRIRMILKGAQAIEGFPRHLSIHVGGFVLSAEPLEKVAPIEPATMDKRTVIPWDKDDLDTLGFFKVDVLGLGMLTALRKMLDAVATDPKVGASWKPLSAIDRLNAIPREDPVVYDAICKADTVGVFQIESRAQMSMLPRLLPRKFYDLVVEVAIVRPGPIQGGMIHPYLKRRRGEELPTTPHPCLDGVLERTLGVPLFQEQVMQIAIKGAGYTGGEADQLRRDMGAWKRNGKLAGHREHLLRGFKERGISEEYAERIYSQIQGFGEYGFPESHAASFALLVYASSWLKVHYPAAFAASLVNSQPMGFYSPSTILLDAQKHGVEVRPILIEASDWDCTLEYGEDTRMPPAIRVGLRQVKGIAEMSGKRIEVARAIRSFTSIDDLAHRASLKRSELDALAESGALESLAGERRDAMWKVRAPRGEPLFSGIDLGDSAPSLAALTRGEQLMLDYERTGFSVGDHPMKLERTKLPRSIKSSRELEAIPHKTRVTIAGMVICRQRPMTASGVVFLTLEDEWGFLNAVIWTRVFETYRHVITTSTLLTIHGKVERDSGVIYVIADRIECLQSATEIPSMSRDFH